MPEASPTVVQPVGAATAVFSYDQHYASWSRRVLRSFRARLAQAARPLVVSAAQIRRALAALAPDRQPTTDD